MSDGKVPIPSWLEREWNRKQETWELSSELAEIVGTLLQTLCEYCEKQNIPIDKETGIWNLMSKARHILKLIEETNSSSYGTIKLPFSKTPNGFSQRERPNKDFTIPLRALYKGGYSFPEH